LYLINTVTIRTDSKYISDNYYNAKYGGWQKSKWHGSTGRPLLNVDLWKDLIRLMKRVGKPVLIEWVKGHSKDEHNKVVDRLLF
jgi:ribonuclease HI